MAYEKYTTEQLKKAQKILLGLSIVALLFTVVMLVYGIMESSDGGNSSILFLVPTVFGPLSIFPALFASSGGSELKKRGQNPS